MAPRARDIVVAGVLVVGTLCALLAWHPLGRWVAFGMVLGTVLLAALVYRLRPSAVPWRDDAAEREPSAAPERTTAGRDPR